MDLSLYLTLMLLREKLKRFASKSRSEKWVAIKRRVSTLACRGWETLNQRYRRRRIFQEIYNNNLWGSDAQSRFFSGVGSRGESAELYVQGIGGLLERHVREIGRPLTVVDLGCGDFQVGRALVTRIPDLIYVGCDIVPELIAHNTKTYANERISFKQLDIVADPLPRRGCMLSASGFTAPL